ncbi:trypsin-like peptidase domain-containing protein [Opitutales bacterium]|jgi:serine protease Do|nr:trypsin-like peptidase domain-containing protein [Opitutales bacterium]
MNIVSRIFRWLLIFLACLNALGQSSGFSLKVDDAELDRLVESPIQSYSAILGRSTPAVVAVTTQQVVKRLYPGGGNPIEEWLRRYYGLPRMNQPRIEEEKVPAGIGSGVIVSPQGHVVTNAHVITDPQTGELMEEVVVQLNGPMEYPAEIIGYDHSTDIAVLKINADEELPFATLTNSDQLKVGDIVFAVGNPLGIGMTVTMGIVSATRKSELGILRQEGAYENFIQTDASINRGNSGGALLDAKGRLVGINTAIISQTGANIGIGLAIPVNMVRRALTDYLEEGKIRRGFLGVSLEPDSNDNSAVVGSVVPGSAAEKAGFMPDDKIIKVGEKPVYSVNQARVAISQSLPGSQISIEVIRNGTSQMLSVILDSMSEDRAPIPGIELSTLTPQNRENYKIPLSVRGVLVTESTGESETFKKGVVLVEINGSQIQQVGDVAENLYSGINRFYVWYRGKYRFLAYRTP